MDGSAFNGLAKSVEWIFRFAIIGIISAIALAFASVGFIIWFVIHHVAVV